MAKPKRSKKDEIRAEEAAGVAQSGSRCMVLAGPLEVQQVEAAREQLLELLEAGTNAAVDISGITSIDTAGVQLLWALRTEAPRCGLSLEFRGSSAATDIALRSLGLPGLAAEAAPHGV